MKIERDKVYLTRCGQKVRVVCVDAGIHLPVVAIHDDGEIYSHRVDGGFLREGESGNDLVSEYVEPPKPREVWVTVHTGGYYGPTYTDEERDNAIHSGLPLKFIKFREVIEA